MFQNRRSSRQTELAETFPAHVVCQWIGNSEAVARGHYLQTTDEHFARAVATEKKASRKPSQSMPEWGGNIPNTVTIDCAEIPLNSEKPPKIEGLSMCLQGFEP